MMMFFSPSPKLCTEGVIMQIHNWSTDKIFVTDSHSEADQVEMENKRIQYDLYLGLTGWLAILLSSRDLTRQISNGVALIRCALSTLESWSPIFYFRKISTWTNFSCIIAT